MIRQGGTTTERWVVAAGFIIVAASLLSLTAFTQRGGVAPQGTPVRGPNGEVWGFSDTAFNPNTRWRIHDPERRVPPVVDLVDEAPGVDDLLAVG